MDMIAIVAGLVALAALVLLILPFVRTKPDGNNSIDIES